MNMTMRSRVLVAAVSLGLGVGVVAAVASPGPTPAPTGARVQGQSELEPVFNAENYGEVGYVKVPSGTQQPLPANPASWSPIYLLVYPDGSTITTSGTGATGPLDCQHIPMENCPSHGNAIAALAMKTIPSVYGGGVLGHDHVMDFPGGDDWNVAWEPVVVLFTSATAADTRLLTDTQIDNFVSQGKAIEIRLPQKTFHCSLAPVSVWDLSTPAY